MAYPITTKVIKSGDKLEFYKYEDPVYKGFKAGNRQCRNPDNISPEEKQENRRRSMRRARKKVMRYVNANAEDLCRFWTLTFSDNKIDLDQANEEFKNFTRRLRYHYPDIEYICVVEFQKRGAVHYHMLINKWINQSFMTEVWSNGYTWVNYIPFSDIDNLGLYISKYMTKENDERLRGQKSYWTSTGIKKPIEINNPTLEQIKKLFNLYKDKYEININCLYNTIFETEYFGSVIYSIFSIKLSPI